jgi:hypothetical protein
MFQSNPSPSPATPANGGTIHFNAEITGLTVQPTPTPQLLPWTERALGEDFVSVLLIFVFVIVVISQIRLAQKKVWNSASIKIVGITTIAFIGVFAALTVDNQQNGPAIFGLLGTIAGYLLGKSDRPNSRTAAADQGKESPSPDASKDGAD